MVRRMGTRGWACGMVAAVFLMSPGRAPADAYEIGFAWNRYDDWTVRPDSDHLTTNGNPDDDALANPVWGYEYFHNVPAGSDLDSGHPWYEGGSTPLLWDRDHWGVGGRWADGHNKTPNIANGWITHSRCDTEYSYFNRVPVVRWMNPLDQAATVSLTSGDGFRIAWVGNYQAGGAGQVTVDAVIALVDTSNGNAVHVLWTETVDRPGPDLGELGVYLDLPPLNLVDVPIEPGDDLLITVRARSKYSGRGGRVIGFYDDLSITLAGFESNPIQYITAETLDSSFVPDGVGGGELHVAGTCGIFVEAEKNDTYEGGTLAMDVSLFRDDSNDGVAAGVFRGGLISLADSEGRALLAGEVTEIVLQEVVVSDRSLLAGVGEFLVTGGLLADDFAGPGEIVQITFDFDPNDIADFALPFTGVSNITLMPIPDPATLSLLALGGLALARRRKR